ncbi:helix-turn-helix domain-containing protein [Quadrisphaera setariae]|uniref:helix-turn-helix domain-containing protein n=1 Tax=Quadrisphaera setariae TaxID=2593304 RepID=UPI0034E26BA4
MAEMLRTPESTVRYWRHIGAGPLWIKVGRRVIYRRDDVLTWLVDRRSSDAAQRVRSSS